MRPTALKSGLERMITQFPQGTIADCRVIEVLSHHALYAEDHCANTGSGLQMNAIWTFAVYAAAALAEIAGCFAVWAWMRLGVSVLWLVPG